MTIKRYLHPYLVQYAERLTSTLPDSLSVCFFVCTGSEANDLALRLARNYTSNYDVIVLDSAYHGNLTSLVEISPYKYQGPGGFQERNYVHKAITPDTYRGPIKASNINAGPEYAKDVKRAINEAEKKGRKIAAFIAESLMGCAGQIVLPKNYLPLAYKYAREAGAVCIADEVQVGFGRVGSAFWGFELQNVVPDVVTMGKPIGNGFPMAAVVTTKEIADAFANGMEYFNTFGGCTVACSVGLAVLDTIASEKLQENAFNVGKIILNGLNELRDKYQIIGDVRGKGLFVGIELVKDRISLQPAEEEAEELAHELKRKGVLVSTDGPNHNVIKIKPPLCFSTEDCETLLKAFDEALLNLKRT